MPGEFTSLLEAAATLGLKAKLIEEEFVVEAPDNFRVAGNDLKISVEEPGKYIVKTKKKQYSFSDPRTALAFAYNYASTNLSRELAGTVSWTKRILESYFPTRKERDFYSKTLHLRGDPRALLLAVSFPIIGEDVLYENLALGLSRFEVAGRVVGSLRKKFMRLRNIRHSRMGLLVLGELQNINPWTLLAAAYQAAIKTGCGRVLMEANPLSVILAWEMAWLSKACIKLSGLLQKVYGNLAIPLTWHCIDSGKSLHVCSSECSLPVFIPLINNNYNFIPLEPYTLYVAEGKPIALLVGTSKVTIVSFKEKIEGFHESLLSALDAYEEEADPSYLTRLLV